MRLPDSFRGNLLNLSDHRRLYSIPSKSFGARPSPRSTTQCSRTRTVFRIGASPMSHRHTVRTVSSRNRRPPYRVPRLHLGTLEDRVAPAVFTGAGPTLAINLNSANEIATFSTDGATVTVHLTNGTATPAATTVTRGGTSTAPFQSATSGGPITSTDSAAGTSVAFANSTGSYPQAFSITLADPASGNITFAGNSTFGGAFTASTTAGFFA